MRRLATLLAATCLLLPGLVLGVCQPDPRTACPLMALGFDCAPESAESSLSSGLPACCLVPAPAVPAVPAAAEVAPSTLVLEVSPFGPWLVASSADSARQSRPQVLGDSDSNPPLFRLHHALLI